MDPTTARDYALRHALTLPTAWEDHPWGESVAKVGKKVFVFLGMASELDTRGFSLSVKLPESGAAVLAEGLGVPTGYGLGRAGWVTLTFPPGSEVEEVRLRGWIAESFRAVAPKRLARAVTG